MISRTPLVPHTLLVCARAFDERLSAQRVATAIARGLTAGGWPTDLCPIDVEPGPSAGVGKAATLRPIAELPALLDALDFDARMRASRAVILAEAHLREDTLSGSAAFEIATRARQAGVPAYAVTGENRLNAFDARMFDLQAILEAASARSLQAAGRKLAELV
jgi:glycerate kinase